MTRSAAPRCSSSAAGHGQRGQVAVLQGGTGKVRYQSPGCGRPGHFRQHRCRRRDHGFVVGGRRRPVDHRLANRESDNRRPILALTGEYLKPNTFVSPAPVTALPLLIFEMNGKGSKIMGDVTSRLAADKFPLATFLDGEPITGDNNAIIAPTVQSQITDQGEISGLSSKEARQLSKLLNTGAFPIPLRVVQQQDSTRWATAPCATASSPARLRC
jgi:hypothetical protein